MSWIEHPQPEAAATEFGRSVLQSRLERNQGHLDMFAAMYTFPELSDHMVHVLQDAFFGETALSSVHKGMLAALVSSLNGCQYCTTAHGELLRRGGADDSLVVDIAQNYHDADVDGKVRVLLDFAYKLTLEPSSVTKGDWDGVTTAGWTRAQAIEAVHITGLFAYLNRVADGFGMESRGLDRPKLLEGMHARPDRYKGKNEVTDTNQ